MKNNKLKSSRLKKILSKFKLKNSGFFIIALSIVLLSTAIIWRYTLNPSKDEGNNLALEENENVGVNVDPYEDYIQGLIDSYGENKENSSSNEGSQTKVDLTTMKNPLLGELLRKFTMEDLVYYEAIGEWRVHSGIDIKPTNSLIVEAAMSGKVESVKSSEITGTEVVIDHGNNTKTLYNNLVNAKVKVGQEVGKGEEIGNIGKVVSIEAKDGAHLHFELVVDGKNVDPLDYINVQ